jgi:hypothetical protein
MNELAYVITRLVPALFGGCRRLILTLLLIFLETVFPSSLPAQTGADFSIATQGYALEAGQFLPLVIGLHKDAGPAATITVTMKANMFFPQDQVMVSQTLPNLPQGVPIAVSFGSAVGLQTPPDIPTGTGEIELVTTVDNGPASPPQDVKFKLTVLATGGLANLITIPVRWCAIEGSPQAQSKKAGDFVNGDYLLALLRKVNYEVFVPRAMIEFQSAYSPTGIPVIADPGPAESNSFDDAAPHTGDLSFDNFGSEINGAESECEQAWLQANPNAKGTILVNARLVEHNPTKVGACGTPDTSLMVSQNGTRGDLLCAHPRHLTKNDLAPCQSAFVVDQGSSHIISEFGYPNYDEALTVAHELGHSLMLGHGKGVDPNHTPQANPTYFPPADGPRRFDGYCDPLAGGAYADDNPADQEGLTAPNTIVTEFNSAYNMTDLQSEQAREVAKLIPGAAVNGVQVDPSGSLVSPPRPGSTVPADVRIVAVQIAEDPLSQITSLLLKVTGPIPSSANNEYFFFVDTDNNALTGGNPSSLGLPTAFQGAELAVRVSLGLDAGAQTVTPTVWMFQGGAFVQVNDPKIQASVFTPGMSGTDGLFSFGHVSIIMPDDVPGILGVRVRLQAAARQLNGGGQLDRLPQAPDGGGTISLAPPQVAQCQVNPQVLRATETASITASGLIPNQTAEVYLGDTLVATGPIDNTGSATINLVIPSNIPQGPLPVSVKVQGSAVTAESGLVVLNPAGIPVTLATLSPAPNLAGWNDRDVTVTLNATAAPGGPAIDHITYTAAGAKEISTTKVSGSSAAFVINTEGGTAVTFFATDASGISENLEQIVIKLDASAPTITGSASPTANAAGWNNSDVTVSFNSSDTVSGVLSSTRPTVLHNDGKNQAVTGIAVDVAFNSATATVGGINIDETAPVVTVSSPTPTSYVHSSTLTLAYSTSDNLSGVKSVAASMDGLTSVGGHDLLSGQQVNLLTDLSLGTHTFTVVATDYADNSGTKVVTFNVIVTAQSIQDDVKLFVATQKVTQDEGTSLLSKLVSAAKARTAGNCPNAATIYQSFISEVMAQTGKKIDPVAANILIADAQYLIVHCP